MQLLDDENGYARHLPYAGAQFRAVGLLFHSGAHSGAATTRVVRALAEIGQLAAGWPSTRRITFSPSVAAAPHWVLLTGSTTVRCDAWRRELFSTFASPDVEAPPDLAQHLVHGSVVFARGLGFEPHEELAVAAVGKRPGSVLYADTSTRLRLLNYLGRSWTDRDNNAIAYGHAVFKPSNGSSRTPGAAAPVPDWSAYAQLGSGVSRAFGVIEAVRPARSATPTMPQTAAHG
ncbi:hypothetical protein [Streptomyces sp. CC219B]|uniref:hypothetical protein n=1 Tax=Streptomyces sp. CC219B TaxID=3044574 RepID=UPI0024A95993|nr:hypothetical protein [Streptomyces sp. CC219B]